jgi:regulator of CtrA degradation
MREDSSRLGPFERLRLNNLAMQVTACLGTVTAWLMAQRAVEAGEIGRDEAQRDDYRLGQCPLCDAEEPAIAVPQRLEGLVGRTLQLYHRVERLDRLMGGDPAPAIR